MYHPSKYPYSYFSKAPEFYLTSNEADGNEETNQLEAPLILSNRRSKSDQKITSKSDGNIGDKVKYGSLEDIQFVGAVRGLTE